MEVAGKWLSSQARDLGDLGGGGGGPLKSPSRLKDYLGGVGMEQVQPYSFVYIYIYHRHLLVLLANQQAWSRNGTEVIMSTSQFVTLSMLCLMFLLHVGFW